MLALYGVSHIVKADSVLLAGVIAIALFAAYVWRASDNCAKLYIEETWALSKSSRWRILMSLSDTPLIDVLGGLDLALFLCILVGYLDHYTMLFVARLSGYEARIDLVNFLLKIDLRTIKAGADKHLGKRDGSRKICPYAACS